MTESSAEELVHIREPVRQLQLDGLQEEQFLQFSQVTGQHVFQHQGSWYIGSDADYRDFRNGSCMPSPPQEVFIMLRRVNELRTGQLSNEARLPKKEAKVAKTTERLFQVCTKVCRICLTGVHWQENCPFFNPKDDLKLRILLRDNQPLRRLSKKNNTRKKENASN